MELAKQISKELSRKAVEEASPKTGFDVILVNDTVYVFHKQKEETA